jgi:hypothetical protein
MKRANEWTAAEVHQWAHQRDRGAVGRVRPWWERVSYSRRVLTPTVQALQAIRRPGPVDEGYRDGLGRRDAGRHALPTWRTTQGSLRQVVLYGACPEIDEAWEPLRADIPR